MTTRKIPVKIKNDYLLLPLQLPRDRKTADATHVLYLRRHQPRGVATADDSRALFVSNLPVDATEAHLRALFVAIGSGTRVERVEFEDDDYAPAAPSTSAVVAVVEGKKRKRPADDGTAAAAAKVEELKLWDRPLHRSGSNAVVRFVDDASATAALRGVQQQRRKKQLQIWGEGVSAGAAAPALGASRYAAHHRLRFPSSAHLQASMDAFVAAFGEAEEAARRAAARRRTEPDTDGFVTVTRGARGGKAVSQEAVKATLEEKERKKGELRGFYRFQIREEKKAKQLELLAKFEEDRKRVAERKMGRKFRPE